MTSSMSRLPLAAVVLALGLLGCSGSVQTAGQSTSASSSPTTAPSGEPTALPTPEPTEQATPEPAPDSTPSPTSVPTPTVAGLATCVSPADEDERTCALDTGTYQTVYSLPGTTYEVTDPGWGSIDRDGAPGNFVLLPPGATLEGAAEGTGDVIVMFEKVVAAGPLHG